MKRVKTELREGPSLDSMLLPSEAASWLRMGEANLRKLSPDFKPVIPAFRVGGKTTLFHPRTIIAHLAKKNGVSEAVIAASFGFDVKGGRA